MYALLKRHISGNLWKIAFFTKEHWGYKPVDDWHCHYLTNIKMNWNRGCSQYNYNF